MLPVRIRIPSINGHDLMPCHAHSEEIFGPALTVIISDTLDDALSVINENKYGNGAVIFTQSGATARKFESEVNVGQVRSHSCDSEAWALGAASAVGPDRVLMTCCPPSTGWHQRPDSGPFAHVCVER